MIFLVEGPTTLGRITRIADALGGLLRRIWEKCNDRVVRVLRRHLQAKGQEITYVSMELREAKDEKSEIELRLLDTTDSEKLTQLKELKDDAESRYQKADERLAKLFREADHIRKEIEDVTAIPCAE